MYIYLCVNIDILILGVKVNAILRTYVTRCV